MSASISTAQLALRERSGSRKSPVPTRKLGLSVTDPTPLKSFHGPCLSVNLFFKSYKKKERKKKAHKGLETKATLRGTGNITPRYFPKEHSSLIGDDITPLSET